MSSLSEVGPSTAWLLNTTYNSLSLYGSASVYVSWHLDVHVVDSIDQDVPSANVTAKYQNATVAESGLTDANDWARLTLAEKMINATGEYQVGDYTAEAVYDTYSNSTAATITGNQLITLALEGLVIPEFPSFLILPVFMMATLLLMLTTRRRNRSKGKDMPQR